MSKPERKHGFSARLGVFGWSTLDPVLLAALATEAPVLLVGPHGTAKTMLVERLARALGLAFRHYNASLLNYDDLVGIPLPDESGGALRFVGTPGAIWDAEFVLIDEISRCRADLQNKLFPVIHERRVAGVDLARLKHRWAAMNPPSPDSPDDARAGEPAYLGSEPLDPALSDRFPFVLRVPGWRELTKKERRTVVLGDAGPDERPADGLAELVEETARRAQAMAERAPERLADYVVQLMAELGKAALPQSPRRARMLFASILAVHAARTALGADPGDLEESALFAVRNGLPQTANEAPPAASAVLAAHRQAWAVSGLAQDSAWRQVLEEGDPAARVALADRLGLGDADVARLVTQALASEEDDARRTGLATALFLSFRARRELTPAAWEPLTQLALRVLQPKQTGETVGMGPRLEGWREINLWSATESATGARLHELERSFVLSGYPNAFLRTGWRAALERFRADLRLFGVADPGGRRP